VTRITGSLANSETRRAFVMQVSQPRFWESDLSGNYMVIIWIFVRQCDCSKEIARNSEADERARRKRFYRDQPVCFCYDDVFLFFLSLITFGITLALGERKVGSHLSAQGATVQFPASYNNPRIFVAISV